MHPLSYFSTFKTALPMKIFPKNIYEGTAVKEFSLLSSLPPCMHVHSEGCSITPF